MYRWSVKVYSLILLSIVSFCTGCKRKSLSPVEIKIDDDSGYTNVGATVSGSTLMSTHVVNNDETLFDIAYKYNIDPMNLADTNGIKAPYKIKNGQVIRLPGEGEPEKKPFIEENVWDVPDVESDKKLDAEFDKIMAVKKLDAVKPGAEKPKLASKGTDTTDSKLKQSKSETVAKSVASSKLIRPISGKITSKFGQMLDGIPNDGINIKAPLGTKIKAAGSGKIMYAGNELQDEFGNVVIIKHDNDLITSYAHLKEIKVKNGVRVKAGDIIGSVGKTGDVTSPQLHFEVMKDKKPVNPELYMSAS